MAYMWVPQLTTFTSETLVNDGIRVGVTNTGYTLYIATTSITKAAYYTGSGLTLVVGCNESFTFWSQAATLSKSTNIGTYNTPQGTLYYYYGYTLEPSSIDMSYYYTSRELALIDMADGNWDGYVDPSYPITYRMTNATHTGPAEAAVGDNVEVPLSFPEGYGIVNASTDAYVTNNGVLIPSQYANGKLTFTMPDPS